MSFRDISCTPDSEDIQSVSEDMAYPDSPKTDTEEREKFYSRKLPRTLFMPITHRNIEVIVEQAVKQTTGTVEGKKPEDPDISGDHTCCATCRMS